MAERLVLEIYLLGCVPFMLIVAAVAFHWRKSHCLRPQAAASLILLTSMLWPVLLVAAMQFFGLIALARGPRSIRALNGYGVKTVGEPAPTSLGNASAAA